ncbi:MAG: outer membrane beta-barrel protein [Janthinobacterium lividum]
MPNSTLFYINFTVFRRWLLLSSGLALVPLAGQAQGRAAISGTIGNAAGAQQEYVLVTLHRAADSVVVKTEFTDQHGAFKLEAAAGGRYLVSASPVGFQRYWSAEFGLPAAGLALPAIRLVASPATTLGPVTVTGRKPLYERLADRTVVHVAESPLAAGSTTLDVLGRAPNVTLTSNGDLRLRGREGLLVYLDGKRVPLTGQDLADYLRALPAEQIQDIELITNPPASYDAQGGAGVIAITLKKDQRLGLNGSVNASYGRGVYGKFVGGGSLNYRRKNLNLYGTYAYTDRRGFTRFNFDRQFGATKSMAAGSSEQFTEQLTYLRTHSAKVGLDLNLSKRTLLGISATGLLSQSDNNTSSTAQFFDEKGQPSSRYTSAAPQDVNRPNGSLNLNLRHAFADSATARFISADVDYARYHTTRLLDLYAFYAMPSQSTSLLTGDQRNNLSIGTAKFDYSQPLPHRARLEAGAKVTQVVSSNDALFEYSTGGTSMPLSNLSYPFRYRENVNAAYVNLRGATPRTTLQAGLRAEQTNTRADSLSQSVREQNYFKLFPSLLVQHTLSKNHSLALSVARRIDRPSYGLVNPLRSYLDPTSYSAGNYKLQPQTSYNFELTHTFLGKFSTALAYARTEQPYLQVSLPTDGGRVIVNQYRNLSRQNFYTLNLTAPLELTKWWTLYANVILYYNQYQGDLNNTALDRGRVAFNLTANSSFTLPGGWTAELTSLYESREVVGYQLTQDRGQVAIGFQKSFWKKQATLRLNVADVFYTTPIRATSTYDNFTETFYQRQDLRVATAALTYRFGNSKVAAARKRAAGADEELRRAGGGQ